MLDDIATIRESQDIPHEYYDYVYDSVAFSHTDMLLVQGAFVAPLLLFPNHFGYKYATEIEIQDFLTLWRTFDTILEWMIPTMLFKTHIKKPRLWVT